MTLKFRPLAALTVAVATGVVAACSSPTLEPLPLEITLQTSRTTAAPGDTISFVATVQGGSLLGLSAEYGDGDTDSFGTSGARTGKVTFRHAYKARGTFTTKITVTDGLAGQKDASVQIKIN